MTYYDWDSPIDSSYLSYTFLDDVRNQLLGDRDGLCSGLRTLQSFLDLPAHRISHFVVVGGDKAIIRCFGLLQNSRRVRGSCLHLGIVEHRQADWKPPGIDYLAFLYFLIQVKLNQLGR